MTIKKVTLASGGIRYRVAVSSTGDDGQRHHLTRSFRVKKDAEKFENRFKASRDDGTLTRDAGTTVGQLLNIWLARRDDLKPSTKASYETAIARWDPISSKKIGSLRPSHVQSVVDTMKTAGRKPSTIKSTVQVLAMALDEAVKDRQVAVNAARLAKVPTGASPEMARWSRDEAVTFAAVADSDEHAALWRLALVGLRRGELAGAKWEDLDLSSDSPTMHVQRARVSANGTVHEGPPKSERSVRFIDLPDAHAEVLRRVRRERGVVAGYIAADVLGRPLHPDTISDLFRELVKRAGVPIIRLHDVRHTAGSLMADNGMQPYEIAHTLGHADGGALAMKTYIHPGKPARSRAREALAL